MSASPFEPYRFRRHEYARLIEAGIFAPDERLELLDGLLVVREPQGSPHATAVSLTQQALQTAFGPGWNVRAHLPVALDDMSEPEPDVSLVPGHARDYRDRHPARPALLVEVAETEASLAVDRRVKGGLYAKAGVPEYWIVNLVDRVLEVYRDPGPSPAASHGTAYRAAERLGPSSSVWPVALPSARVAVADLLP
jgi:Uma2 family endonuclease